MLPAAQINPSSPFVSWNNILKKKKNRFHIGLNVREGTVQSNRLRQKHDLVFKLYPNGELLGISRANRKLVCKCHFLCFDCEWPEAARSEKSMIFFSLPAPFSYSFVHCSVLSLRHIFPLQIYCLPGSFPHLPQPVLTHSSSCNLCREIFGSRTVFPSRFLQDFHSRPSLL